MFDKLSQLRINHGEHKALDAIRERVRVLKAKEETKLVIVDKNASVGNMMARKARIRIVSIVVNLVTLLVIALCQR